MSINETLDQLERPADRLRGLAGGAIHLPGDPGYDAARAAWNLAVDQRPAAVAVPRDADDVARIVRAAHAAGLRVAPQSTGHNAGPLAAGGLDDVVIVRTSELNDVSVDPERRIVRVGGGTVWLPAVKAAAEHGLTVLHGSSVDVGIAGYSLGGGMGWYARKLGLAANSLTAVEIVLANGDLVRADTEHHAELFWAVRGGGGNFGIVTALEFRAYDFSTAYAGLLMWDVEMAPRVLDMWRAWAPVAPDEVTTSFRILRIPPIPEMPDFLRGRTIVVIDGAVLADDERAADILAPLRALEPELDTFGRVPSETLVHLHMDPEEPAPGIIRSTMLRELDDAGAEAFLGLFGPGVETPLMIAELRQLGGALGRPHEGGGVLTHLEGEFALVCGGMAPTPELGSMIASAGERAVAALGPWSNGRSYLNFAEEPTDTRTAYADEVWLRLAAVRSAVDPDGVFVANHAIPRLYENGRPTR
ncbi:FAD-binding oxidoreductase [Aeromicrobium choanae]|uniref:FAD/FMN-containing dehydrogenase n=1 Tax=Aeromicrobium choanae TaxID=1736691 RepID=A0A1T4Z000_9ACTN|nr:FAD-binding oxidoreductase [Aeromicrobium choanae]SKB07354.1 FAD/FMN-containing dehydrogenase [Aeromicrobium choanae]